MVRFVEGIDRDDPRVRRINYAIGGEHTPEWYAHIARLEARKTAEKARLAARKDVPARRKPPRNDDTLVSSSDEEFVFAQDQARDVELKLSQLRVYPTGIRFDLIARAQDDDQATFIGERINLTHRFRRSHKHRIYLGIVLPDGTIATNRKCTPPQAPEDDDPTTPWLYGGKSYSRQSETGATYFLSPRPEGSGEVVFTISYPEIGIDRASSITLDFTSFTRLRP